MQSTIDSFEARQRRSADYQAARRTELEPLYAKRRELIAALEEEQARFIGSMLGDLTADKLEPFDNAAKAAQLDVIPSFLLDSLRKQSERAARQCQTYERERNIYAQAENLPEREETLTKAKNKLLNLERELERHEELLATVKHFTIEQAEQLAGKSGLAHLRLLLTDKNYRAARKLFGPLEAKGLRVADQLSILAALRIGQQVAEQETEVLEHAVTEQRGWVTAYVEAWTQRLSRPQLKHAVVQAIADQMADANARQFLATHFGRRWPNAISILYAEIAALDAGIKGFLANFATAKATARAEKV
jgi:hypothetical protein